MSLNLIKPTYPCRPIGSLKTLASMLRMSEHDLTELARKANEMYRPVPLKTGRETFDANAPLKPAHARIKATMLSLVAFPDYLTGSLKGRDYKVNAELHKNQAVLICEDVKGFFGAVSEEKVFDIWRNFFNFPSAVAEVLTRLTTKDGALPQGAIPSSYLANLALWRDEPLLQAKLQANGIVYSRYVDDIAMSSRVSLGRDQKKALIASVYGMLMRNGLSAKREKHEIFPATKQMIITKLIGNRKASLQGSVRSNVRAAVHHAERLAATPGIAPEDVMKAINHAANRVGYLGRFHANLADPLRERVRAVRMRVGENPPLSVVTGGPQPEDASPELLPWDAS